MTELRNCPFCGREPDVPEKSVDGYWIECSNPNCMALIESDTKEAAIKAWNTRADGWMTVEPQNHQECLVWDEATRGYEICRWNADRGLFRVQGGGVIRNAPWQPLPQPPDA